jgi:signal transduction histidine kinase/DNA-binding response OmpR family regulator/Txe/YoeB family toxin of Txe-Axe toxin-antitoxin module
MRKNKHSAFWGVVFLLLLANCQGPISTLGEPSGTTPVAVLEADHTNYKLRGFVQVLADTTASYTIEDILQPAQQDKFKTISDEPLVTSNYQYYWGKIQVENRLPDAQKHLEWVLSFSSTWTNLDVFTIGKDGSWQLAPNGSFTPDHLKEFKPTARGSLVKLSLLPGQVETVYFRGISERKAINPTFHIFLQPLDIFFAKLLKEKVNNAIFIGFLLMMLFYNLIVYFFGRDRSFLFYSGYLLMVVVYACYSSDDLADWFGTVLFPDHPAYYSFFKLSIYLGLICYLAFIRSFLDLEQLLSKWDRYFKVVISLGFLLIGLYVVVAWTSNFSYILEDRVTMFYISLVILSCFLLIYPLYKTKDAKGYFVVAGIAVVSLGCFLTLTSRLLPTPYSIFYLKAAAVIEILIFSLGLAYRQRQQAQAREQADFALKESQLIQEKKQLEADRLQELNNFKARFYTNITHEFRTPLTVIMGMSENIKDHPQEKKLIQRNSANLLRLINQLLDLSKLESGSLVLKKVHQDIIVYLQYLTESFYSNATQKNIRLVFYSEEKEVMMDYDEEKILQIIYNLLSNALKFTREDGKIVFHASKIEEKGQPVLKLKVKDDGQGISPADIPHIFDRFYQVNNANFRQAEGAGIGLALTKELVELMNGRIEVESELGVGTEFLLYLPIKAQLPATQSTAANATVRFNNKESEDLVISSMQTANDPSITKAIDSELPELLIIEDNEDIITYIKTVLSGQYVFHTAKNGVLGIEKAFEIIPDIIISDVMMPEKNGYEVCETLKQDERTSHIPIVLLTAKSSQEDKVEGLKFGADAYLTKPFDKEELVVRLVKLVTIRQQLQMRYTNVAAASFYSPSIDDVFLEKLHAQIQSQLSNVEFGVPQLIEAAQLSQMQLYRKLKALTGKTPSQFIRAYRLRQALLLLQKGELTISEIAYEVGFADPSYFSRMFQKEFKKNPSDYFK